MFELVDALMGVKVDDPTSVKVIEVSRSDNFVGGIYRLWQSRIPVTHREKVEISGIPYVRFYAGDEVSSFYDTEFIEYVDKHSDEVELSGEHLSSDCAERVLFAKVRGSSDKWIAIAPYDVIPSDRDAAKVIT